MQAQNDKVELDQKQKSNLCIPDPKYKTRSTEVFNEASAIEPLKGVHKHKSVQAGLGKSHAIDSPRNFIEDYMTEKLKIDPNYEITDWREISIKKGKLNKCPLINYFRHRSILPLRSSARNWHIWPYKGGGLHSSILITKLKQKQIKTVLLVKRLHQHV